MMRLAYADPPYVGCAKYYKGHPDFAGEVDHAALVARLVTDFPDGWALSLSSPSLRQILPLCPEDVRVMSWVKPFASFKPGVNPAYAWEPVIVRGGRPRTRRERTVRDWVACNITLKKGLTGAKPYEFCAWIFDVLGASPDDELVDLFPGTGSVVAAWETWKSGGPMPKATTRGSEEPGTSPKPSEAVCARCGGEGGIARPLLDDVAPCVDCNGTGRAKERR